MGWIQSVLLLLLIGLPCTAQAQQPTWQISIKGAIGVVTTEYVITNIDAAHQLPPEQRPQAIILTLDTPGGLDASTREMIQRILDSDIPIVGYVTPRGARAASAGTYILYATHVAAMSPATTIGAATPVQMGGPQAPAQPSSDDDEQDAMQPKTAMERKIINDAVSYIVGLAELRGRNAEWAEKAVREAATVTAKEAKEIGAVELVATDINDLMQQLQGMEIDINGNTVQLDTKNSELQQRQASWRQELLAILTNPNVAYILLLLGVYGLIFEASNPGMGIPGIAGAIFLVLALYAFQVLPVSYAAMGLMLFGLGLMAAEAISPSFGLLGLGGIVAFVFGSIMLIDDPQPAFQIALPLIFAVALASALFCFLTIGMLVKTRRAKVVSGTESLSGTITEVESISEQGPMVRLQGELWHAVDDGQLQVGDRVRVKDVDGLTVKVNKLE